MSILSNFFTRLFKSKLAICLIALVLAVLLIVVLFLAMPSKGTELSLSSDYVRTVSGTEGRMLSAEFWIRRARAAETIVMTPAEIEELNQLNSRMLDDGICKPFALSDVGETVSGELVRNLISLYKMPEKPESLYLNGKPTDEQYWQRLLDNIDADAVLDTVKVRFGYSVARSTLRACTTYDFIGETAEDTYYDEALHSELLPYLPLAVIHESADGEWYYVLMYGMSGWVRKDFVALCETREDWLERQAVEEFLTVTGRELRLGLYPTNPELSSLLLPMGTRLPLVSAESAPESLCGRQSFDCYVVRLPVRGEDGMIEDEYFPVPVSEDVCFGFLPYTRANVIRQAFKLLGDRYGWGGDHYATDCSGLVHEVYACFGFELHRVAGVQEKTQGLDSLDVSEMSEAQKLSKLKKLPIGSLVCFPGHIMIYLGTVNDTPYVINAVGRFATPDMPEGEVLTSNCVSVNSLLVHRRNATTWLDNVTTVVNVENK